MRALESALFFERSLQNLVLSISLLSHLSPHLPCSPPSFSLFSSFTKKTGSAHPTHSACSDASKQDIVSATGSPATANAAALQMPLLLLPPQPESAARGAERTASNAGSAAGSPGSVGPSRLGGNGARQGLLGGGGGGGGCS